jgi:hypothetical protein
MLWKLTVAITAIAGARGITEETNAANLLNGTHLRIVTVEDWPFVSVRRDGDQMSGEIEWSGWIIDLIETLSQDAGFTYSLQLPSGNPAPFGFPPGSGGIYLGADLDLEEGILTNASSDFQTGERVRNESAPNAFVAGAYLTSKRLTAFTATAPFKHAPLGLLVAKQQKSNFMFFLEPLHINVWVVVLFVLLPTVGIVYPLVEPMNREDFTVNGTPRSLLFWQSILYTWASSHLLVRLRGSRCPGLES